MVFSLHLRYQFMDVVKIAAGFQAHLVGVGMIGARARGLFCSTQSLAEGLIHNPAKRGAQFSCQGPGPFQYIIINGNSCSHIVIIA